MKEKILYSKNSQILVNKILLSNKITLGENNMHTCTCKKDTNIVKMYGMEFDLSTPKGCSKYALEVLEGPWEEGSEGEAIILESASETYWYIRGVIKGPWAKGEEIISTDPEWSYEYAREIIKGPWAKGEEAISTDPTRSMQYAKDIIKGPWEKGEKAISKSVFQSIDYAVKVLKGRFPRAEDRLRRTYSNGPCWKEYQWKLGKIGVVIEDLIED